MSRTSPRRLAVGLALACVLLLASPGLATLRSKRVQRFPHLELRVEALNVSDVDGVNCLVHDWRAELDSLQGTGVGQEGDGIAQTPLRDEQTWQAGQMPSLDARALTSPLLEKRVCPAACPGTTICCNVGYDCCLTLGCCALSAPCCGGLCCSSICCFGACCYAGYSCCNANLCCAAGKFCCNSKTCCDNGQVCNNGVCSDPVVYTTVTTTSYSTVRSTYFSTFLNSVTSTVATTVFSTAVITSSNIATATSTHYITSTTTTTVAAAKRELPTEMPMMTAIPTPVGPGIHKAQQVGPPRVTIGPGAGFDALIERLENRGVIVERTMTSTVYKTITSFIYSYTTSVVNSYTTFYKTNVQTSVITSTVFLNAQSTIDTTSTVYITITFQAGTTVAGPTVTVGPPPPTNGGDAVSSSSSSSSSSSTSSTAGGGGGSAFGNTAGTDSTDGGLSTGAKIGIGAGVGGGFLAALALLAFCLWRRRRARNEEAEKDIAAAVPNHSYLAGVQPTNPLANGNGRYAGGQGPEWHPNGTAAAGAGVLAGAAAAGLTGPRGSASARDSHPLSAFSTGSAAPLVAPSSPTSNASGPSGVAVAGGGPRSVSGGAWSPPPPQGNELSANNNVVGSSAQAQAIYAAGFQQAMRHMSDLSAASGSGSGGGGGGEVSPPLPPSSPGVPEMPAVGSVVAGGAAYQDGRRTPADGYGYGQGYGQQQQQQQQQHPQQQGYYDQQGYFHSQAPPAYGGGGGQDAAEMSGMNMGRAQGPTQELYGYGGAYGGGPPAHEMQAASYYPAHEMPGTPRPPQGYPPQQ